MMHRNKPAQTQLTTSIDVRAALLRCLPAVATTLFVLILLITVQPGAGTGFA